MATLADIGIKKNWTYETIISCFNGDISHFAPFGIKSPDMESVRLEIYKGSNTLDFILKQREFVINFVDNPSYFFYSLYERAQIRFSEADIIKAPVIINCPAVIEAKITTSIEKTQSYIINADIINIIFNNIPRLFNRAEGLVMESLIASTRIGYMPEGKVSDILNENYRVIKKVAPESHYVGMMEKLLNKCSILK